MKQQISDRINALRAIMKDSGIDAAIIPQTDPHQSEYIADHWQVRRYLSGFTGSAGTLVVTASEALLWTDSRYFIQAADQLYGTEIFLMKESLPETPTIEAYLCDNLHEGQKVGIDGMLFSVQQVAKLQAALSEHGIQLDANFDVVDQIWPDRPSLPKDKVFVHDEKYAGESAKSKIARALDEARQQNAEAAFISPLDEIAWTLNIRCRDVKYNPVATSYLFLSPEENVLFIDLDKLTPDTVAYLESQGVKVKGYDDVKNYLTYLPALKVLVDEAKTSNTLIERLGQRAVRGTSPIAVAKGCKNAVQIAGIKAAMVRDGVALVKSFMEIEHKLADGEKITEMDVADILVKYRSQQPLFFDESFGTIAGYGPHGAIVHYEATEETDVELHPTGLLLVDSGAQYLDGTTDITRTVALGTPTQEEKHDFTLVLKGTIALDCVVFPTGTRGVQLDALARQFLWRDGMTYLHGTGHGVGHFLNVHEGPQTIRLNYTPTPLMEGMVTSDEPGLYKEGVHGIRCENLVLTVPAMTTEFGEFLKFETLTLYPFDLSLMETEIMTPQEIEWVNHYHSEVYDKLSPYLDDNEKAWLKEKTKKL